MIMFSRRQALTLFGAIGAAALAGSALAREQLQDLLADLSSADTQAVDWLRIDMPTLADNPGAVPITVSVNAPDDLRCEEILLVAPNNPRPAVCRFVFSTHAVPEVSTRIRLAETQDVKVYARMSDGSIVSNSRAVTVVGGGCGMIIEEPT
ncbi:thiosulfate oxidation carrier protein SoxY [Aliihoeflea sp. PC F10.4]